MRITTIGRGSLAAACLLLGIANGQVSGPDTKIPENRFVKFTRGFVEPRGFNDDIAVLFEDESPGNKYRTFGWESDTAVVVTRIYLQSTDFSRGLENFTIGSAIPPPFPSVTPASTTLLGKPGVTTTSSSSTLTPQGSIDIGVLPDGPTGSPERIKGTGPHRRQDGTLPTSSLQMSIATLENGGEVSFDSNRLRGKGHGYTEGSTLFFMAEWGHGGRSYSRRFTIVFSADTDTQARQSNLFGDPQPYAREADVMNGGGSEDGGIDTPASTTTPKSGTPNAGSSVNNGLGQGAIIGIAVACGVVGLLLVFGIVWLVVRRRKQKQGAHPGGSYKPEGRGEDLIAEKEANAGVDVTPHSPYSDDGGGAGSGANPGYQEDAASGAPIAGAAVANHRQDQARSYTPYSDLPGAAASASIRTASISHNDEARANVPSPTPGRATPRGLTTPYAHLVEEGMTEEEIRRLEEEERQLDAAIEQAGRR